GIGGTYTLSVTVSVVTEGSTIGSGVDDAATGFFFFFSGAGSDTFPDLKVIALTFTFGFSTVCAGRLPEP
ncbi:hypothetical protein A2U01_0093155, partial [Trifolium medium]|nr:hypothetical protein [Trifolium medium]